MFHRLALVLAMTAAGTIGPVSLRKASAFTTPFTFHCRGDACRAVTFLDEGNGCIVVTSHASRQVYVKLGGEDGRTFDLAPGETQAPLLLDHCYGYYDGGETVTYAP